MWGKTKIPALNIEIFQRSLQIIIMSSSIACLFFKKKLFAQKKNEQNKQKSFHKVDTNFGTKKK